MKFLFANWNIGFYLLIFHTILFYKEIIMIMIYKEDIDELKRLATNTYEQSKMQQINRIVSGIAQLQSKVRLLTIENTNLKEQLKK